MNRRLLWIALGVMVVVALVTVGVIAKRGGGGTPTETTTIMAPTITPGPRPSPQGATYVVDFRNPRPWRELGVRVVTLGSQDGPPAVVGGALTQGSTFTDRVASYFERRSPEPVRSMGVEATFPPAAPTAALAMIVADGQVPDMNVTNVRPNLGVHFVATSLMWELDVWPSNGNKVVLYTQAFDASTFAGPIRYQVELDADTVRVVQPDGMTFAFRDRRIAEYSGNWSAWELFQDGGAVPSARIESWWAS